MNSIELFYRIRREGNEVFFDSPDADFRDEQEATLRRIRIRKNRKN